MSAAAKSGPSSKSAKVLYRPIGIASSLVGGLVANAVFAQVWKSVVPDGHTTPPNALDTDHRMSEILAATALQGAIFAVTKVVVDRAGAVMFQRITGDWPGE
ncbi:DUF4235 domain-containing protein [Dietzia natronolimnaea]|uniref:DUF4235 domain-containing protein n=1 Tax=Dietzia natronolimnaea TaxID=161920 RepID=UPI003D10D647